MKKGMKRRTGRGTEQKETGQPKIEGDGHRHIRRRVVHAAQRVEVEQETFEVNVQSESSEMARGGDMTNKWRGWVANHTHETLRNFEIPWTTIPEMARLMFPTKQPTATQHNTFQHITQDQPEIEEENVVLNTTQ